MVIIKKKITIKREHSRAKKELKLATSALLDVIYNVNKGIHSAAKKCEESASLLSFWRKQGYVTLRKVKKISEALGYPPIMLNFEEFRNITDSKAIFRRLVEAADFSKIEKAYILSKKLPL